MAVQFTYDIGYMGVVQLQSADGTGNKSTVLATGGNINVQQTPIFSTGVWGAGWYTAAQQVAYAPNYITTSGSVNYQLTGGDAFSKLRDFGFEKRNKGMKIIILPNGKAGYQGVGWCQGMSFSASQDAIVTGDFNFKTGNVQNCISTTSYSSSQADTGTPKTGNTDLNASFGSSYLNVFPFWASGVLLQTSTNQDMNRPTSLNSVADANLQTDVIDWNTSYSTQLVLVATCANYSTLSASKQARYAALGTMTADGSFTIFKIASELNPENIRKCRRCTIAMGTAAAPQTKAKINYGAVVFQSGSTDVQTGSSFIQSSFNFSALGTGKSPVMTLTALGGN